MGVQVLWDDFNRAAGSLASPWDVRTGNTWTLDGQRLEAASGGPPTTGYAAEVQRAILGTDPYPMLGGSVAANDMAMAAQVDIYLPSDFESAGHIYGLSLFGESTGDDLPVLLLVWDRAAGGAQVVSLVAVGANEVAGTTWFNAAMPANASAGDKITLRAEIDWPSGNSDITVRAFVDGTIVATATVTSAQLFSNGWSNSPSPTNVHTVDHYVGLYAVHGGTINAGGSPTFPVKFDNFEVTDEGVLAQGAVLNPEPALPADPTLTTVSVSGEDIAPNSLTLSIQPSYAYTLDDQMEVIKHPFDSGHSQSRTRGDRRQRFRLVWGPLSTADKDTLWGMLQSAKGTYENFDWTHPETDESITSRAASAPEKQWMGSGSWTVSCDVEEVHA